jgi:hypothetical protein
VDPSKIVDAALSTIKGFTPSAQRPFGQGFYRY